MKIPFHFFTFIAVTILKCHSFMMPASHAPKNAFRCSIKAPRTIQMMDQNLFFNIEMAKEISAWSVSSQKADLAAYLFQASLLPYLAFLFFISRPETGTPKGGTFGFAFLLVFVAATIPAGIIAKTQYGDILANVDYLHGTAESLLTVTNLLIVTAFRRAVEGETRTDSEVKMNSFLLITLLAMMPIASPMIFMHNEPSNALSFPTWMVHTSSIAEWLTSMFYIWKYSSITKISQWKGLTWAMVPLHSSGLCACVYHIFYNSPAIAELVTLQAGLTCFGNTTMALAAWRIFEAGKNKIHDQNDFKGLLSNGESDITFYGKLLLITLTGSALIKWGELFFNFPFEPNYTTAGMLIAGPTLFNAYKWYNRSQAEDI